MREIKNIVIIGAGNVGTRLAFAFHQAGCRIVQVAGRRENAVKNLAEELGAGQTLSFQDIIKAQDMYLLALPDRAITEVLPQLGLDDELLVHASGSVPMDILSPYSKNTGVFYPLQTFSRSRMIGLKDVPVFIEASSSEMQNALIGLAGKLSQKVVVADSHRRQRIHLAAVFACNFSNHMFTLACKLMEENGLDFDLLVPLIRETAIKAVEMGPDEAQTGPAKRNDADIIGQHLQLLKDDPVLQDLYRQISKSINDQYKP